jgi:4-diphosphocytidyl-2-C-methyl-D-erythritol kinase
LDWRIRRAPAKINLGLRVIGRRADGYHLLDSLVVFADVSDHVAVRATKAVPVFLVRGPFAQALVGAPAKDNLAVQAAALFRGCFGGSDHDIRLWKRLPVASGIGGGSADAAAILRLLAEAQDVSLDDGRLLELALTLGADTPMCLHAQACRVGGIGEGLSPAPRMPSLPAVLVNTGDSVSTPAVFKRRAGPFTNPAHVDSANIGSIVSAFGNDLASAAMEIAPKIGLALQALRDTKDVCVAAMSGSGATCFALYPSFAAARAGAAAVRQMHPDWWTVTTTLNRTAGRA